MNYEQKKIVMAVLGTIYDCLESAGTDTELLDELEGHIDELEKAL